MTLAQEILRANTHKLDNTYRAIFDKYPTKSHLTNRPDFFMVYTLFDHRNDGLTSHRRVVSLPSFEHFMASFPWFIRVQTMKKSGRFIIYNNMKKFSGIWFTFRCQIVKTKSVRVALRIALFSWFILASTKALNQSAHENLDSYCKV